MAQTRKTLEPLTMPTELLLPRPPAEAPGGTEPYRIPFNRPSICGKEYQYIAAAITAGHASGDGVFTKRCQRLLEDMLGAGRVLLTTSCTHALEMAAMLLDVGPGDEVIVPSFTFVSTANAFTLRGARPVFGDIRPDTLNLDETQLPDLITPRTKVILPVHYGGVGCEMDTILALAAERNIAVVEDNAHGLLGQYKDRSLGTLGCLAAQSFHETKNFSCGEGGALVINDPALFERAEIIREKGTNRSQFFRGKVSKYSWQDLGSSYVPSDLLAAFLLAQLERRDKIQSCRQHLWQTYDAHLKDWAAHHGVQTPTVPDECRQPYHMYYLVMPSAQHRDALIAHLKACGILAVFHYLPLHLSPMGKRLAGKVAQCPVSEDISQRLVRLPFYNDMDESVQSQVIEAVRAFEAW